MGVTKIKHWEADRIANSIAEKAFEHVLAPSEKELQAHLKICYEHCLSALGVEGRVGQLIGLNVLQEAEAVGFKFMRPSMESGNTDSYVEVTYIPPTHDAKLLLRPSYVSWRVEDEDLASKTLELLEKRFPIFQARKELASELKQQMDNKSAKHVMKVWPESAAIVAEYFDIDINTGKDVSMTTPLENLLAKYLTPMLSAPQPQGV